MQASKLYWSVGSSIISHINHIVSTRACISAYFISAAESLRSGHSSLSAIVIPQTRQRLSVTLVGLSKRHRDSQGVEKLQVIGCVEPHVGHMASGRAFQGGRGWVGYDSTAQSKGVGHSPTSAASRRCKSASISDAERASLSLCSTLSVNMATDLPSATNAETRALALSAIVASCFN